MAIFPLNLCLLGVSFATAPLAVRESLSYTPEAAVDLLRSASIDGLEEALVVSTCNRTEFYLAARPGVAVETAWITHVRTRRPHALIGHDDCALVQARGEQAARHLFRVGCGLDSAILGDVHIARQLKQAVGLSADAGRLGPLLDQTFQSAFNAIKAAQTETEIGRGHASLGSAVAGIIRERMGAGARILLMGAGVAARDIARQLSKWCAGTLTIVNRTAETAAALAQQVGARAVEWQELDLALEHADVVIAATSAPIPVVTRDRLEACLRSRRGRSLLAIDTGVPRNLEPVDGLDLVNIEDISVRRDLAFERRLRAVPAVEAIVEDTVEGWRRWCWAQPGEALLRAVFMDEEYRRADLVDRILAAGFPGQRDDLDRLIRRAWRSTLQTHARGLRSWLHDRRTPLFEGRQHSERTPDARHDGGL